MAMVEEQLKKLGLSDNEIKIYLCVLENGKITPARIAKKTSVTRPTVYSVGKSLAKRGFIEMDELSPVLYFISLPPENIPKIVRRQKLEIEEQIKTAEKLVEDLGLIPRSKNYSVPKVRFIDDVNCESFLYKQAEIWNQSGMLQDGTWWGIQDHSFIDAYPVWLKWYFEMSSGKVQSKLITNVEEEGSIGNVLAKKYKRTIKYWAGAKKIKITHAVIGDHIMIAYTQTKPYYIVEMHDPVIAENLRQVFQGLWESLP